MDPDTVNQFIQRAGERTRILGDLDISIISDGNDTSGDGENTENQNITPVNSAAQHSFNPTVGGDGFRTINDSVQSSPPRFPMKDMNTSESASCMKNKWSRLSEANKEFEVEMPKKRNPAAPPKRVSSETPAAAFFAPKLSGVTSLNSSLIHRGTPSYISKTSGNVSSTTVTSSLSSPASKVTDSSSKLTSTPDRVIESVNSSLTCSPGTTTAYCENTSYISVTSENLDESREAIFTFGKKTVRNEPYTDVIAEETKISGLSLNSSAASSSTLSKNSNANDHSVTLNPDHQYNRKVDNLRKIFDNIHDSPSSTQSIDSAPTNFHKSRAMFESPSKAVPTGRYESPMTARRDTGITNVRQYVPSVYIPRKKPANCEIVNGPTFNDSVNYWKNRVRENPGSDDIVDAACSIFGNVKKREYNAPKKMFFGQSAEVPRISPELKRSCMLDNYEEAKSGSTERLGSISETNDERDLEEDHNQEENKSDSDDGSILNNSYLSEKRQTQSLVVTESFEALPALTHSESASGTILSDSFNYKPSKPVTEATTSLSAASAVSSLLEDINNDFTRYKETHPVYDSDDKSSNPDTLKPVGLAHTLSIYRRIENTPTTARSKNKKSDVMKLLQRRSLAAEMLREYTPEEIKNKIHTLEMRINSCEAAVVQSRRALEHARLSKNISGSREEIECIRMITVHQERQRACAMEIARIRDISSLAYHYPRANLQFRDISVVLSPVEQIRDDYDIFIVLRYQEEVIVSRNINITHELYHGDRQININEHLDIPNVSPNFNISFEVYCIRYRRVEFQDKKSFSLKRIIQSPAPERPIKSTVPDAFTRVGQVILTSKDMRSKTVFFVSRKHPLGECCMMRINGVQTDVDDTKWEGFLSFYHVPADGNGVWDLHYVVVADGYVKLWVYPEDVHKKPSLLSLNIRDMYGPASCSTQTTLGFQYDFSMQLYDAQDKVVTIRLSAAEPEDRTSAIEHINRSFKFHNTWRL